MANFFKDYSIKVKSKQALDSKLNLIQPIFWTQW